MTNLIEVNGIWKKYQQFSLEDVHLTVPSGCIFGLFGENGAGKTTLLKAILDIVHPDSGSIMLMGKYSTDPASKEKVAGIFSDSFFHGYLTPSQIGKIMSDLYLGWDSELYKKYCEAFGLSREQKIKEFSRGMRVKLNFSVALARQPKLLILDEATSGLDPVIRSEILDILLEFIQKEDRSVLMSTHITSDLEKTADYIAYIHQGKILFQKEKDQLLEHMAVVKCKKEEIDQVPQEWILGREENAFHLSFLSEHPDQIKKYIPDAVVDKASIEDIMKFFARRDKR